MKYHSASVLTFFTVMILFSCKGKTIIPNQSDREMTCGDGNSVVKSVKDVKGTITYNSLEKVYTIVVTMPHTIDSQDVGIICNLPKSLEEEGKQISFDGEYRTYSKQPIKIFAGQTYYYLKLTRIVVK